VRVRFTRRPSHRHERGTTLIEFALVFPGLCALLFGMIDGGRFLAARVMLSQAAAAGARAACLESATTSDVDAAVAGASTMMSGTSVVWGSTSCVPAGCTFPLSPGDSIFLTIQFDYQAAFFKGFQRNMRQTSRMVCE
jgi:hypothetical protein